MYRRYATQSVSWRKHQLQDLDRPPDIPETTSGSLGGHEGSAELGTHHLPMKIGVDNHAGSF